MEPPAKNPKMLDTPLKYSQVVVHIKLIQNKIEMKITSREPAVVHSHLVDDTGHHPAVVIDIVGMLHSELERTYILNYLSGCSFWVLPARQVLEHLVISTLLPVALL